jgi:hypothetical protein
LRKAVNESAGNDTWLPRHTAVTGTSALVVCYPRFRLEVGVFYLNRRMEFGSALNGFGMVCDSFWCLHDLAEKL